MIRVLHVSSVGEKGGLEAILLNILRCLDRTRFAPEVLLLQDGPLAGEIEETGTKAYVITSGRVRQVWTAGRAISKAVQLIRNEGFDLVHSHNAKAHLYGGLAAWIAGVPSVYHLHGVPRPSLSRDGFVSILSMLMPARRTIACSEYVAETFRAIWRSKREVRVIHNGIVLEGRRTQSDVTVRNEFCIPEGVPLVLAPARLQRGKGVHVLLDSAAEVLRVHPEVYFLVVGGTMFGLEPGYADELQSRSARLGLGSRVIFTGYRSDVMRFFEAADVVVHSSIEPDSFPTVLLEAMALGRPVVATDVGGPREIVDDGVTGFLVRPNRTDELTQALLTLVRASDLRERMGQAGAARMRSLFSGELMTQRLQEAYKEALGRDHRVRG